MDTVPPVAFVLLLLGQVDNDDTPSKRATVTQNTLIYVFQILALALTPVDGAAAGRTGVVGRAN